MKKKILKDIGLFFLTIFILGNIILGYYGVSSIILTTIFYSTVWFTFRVILKFAIRDRGRYLNFKLFLSTIIICLFLSEVSVKYIFKRNAYWESESFSSYPGGVPEIENLIRKYILKQQDLRYRNYRPYTTDVNTSSEFQYIHQYNSLGFRGRDFAADTGFNIVALGDSYTEGVGAPVDSTWPALLEKKLNLRSGLDHHIQCINGGIMGTDPFYEYIMLDKILIKYHPKVVLVCVNQTDIDDVIESGGWERFMPDGRLASRPRPWWFFMYECSPIARLLAHSVFHNWQLVSDQKYQEEKKSAIEKIKNCITKDYLTLSRNCDFKLIVILHPLESELEKNNFSLQGIADTLQKYKTITTINLYDEFRERKIKDGLPYKSIYWKIDRHNNSKGYALWADIVCAS